MQNLAIYVRAIAWLSLHGIDGESGSPAGGQPAGADIGQSGIAVVPVAQASQEVQRVGRRGARNHVSEGVQAVAGFHRSRAYAGRFHASLAVQVELPGKRNPAPQN